MTNQHGASEYILSEGTKLAPPVAVSGGLVAGLDLQSWVLIATLIYTVLQIILSVRKFFKKDDDNVS